MSAQGTVKSFNGGKGYGFILMEPDGTDVFVHERDCGGASPLVGDTVNFDTEESPTKPGSLVAKNVVGCSGLPEGKGGKGTVKGGNSNPQGTGQFSGSVKSYSEAKGFGFIIHGDGDVFFHQRDMVDGSVTDRGDMVKFDLEENPGKPGTMKATNVTGGSKGKGQGKGKEKGGYGAMEKGSWGMDPWGFKGKGAAWGPYGGGDPWGMYGGWGGDAWGGGWGGGGKGKSKGGTVRLSDLQKGKW